jgi:hypothetical protein
MQMAANNFEMDPRKLHMRRWEMGCKAAGYALEQSDLAMIVAIGQVAKDPSVDIRKVVMEVLEKPLDVRNETNLGDTSSNTEIASIIRKTVEALPENVRPSHPEAALGDNPFE